MFFVEKTTEPPMEFPNGKLIFEDAWQRIENYLVVQTNRIISLMGERDAFLCSRSFDLKETSMNFREALNRRPTLSAGIVGLILVGSITAIVVQWFGSGGPSTKAFFTTDDSSQQAALAAMFRDEAVKIPPFDHNGKPAYRAYVFTFDGGRTKYINFLERYTPQGQAKMRAYQDALKAVAKGGPPVNVNDLDGINSNGKEIMKPGVTPWGKINDYKHYDKATKIEIPAGKSLADMEPVE